MCALQVVAGLGPRRPRRAYGLLTITLLAVLGLTAASPPSVARAQGVKITTPEPTPEPRVVTPGLLYEKRPSDDLYYLGIPPSVPYDPAFIEPFMLQVATPTGLFVCFIEPKAARELATGLELLGAAAETGLILASS